MPCAGRSAPLLRNQSRVGCCNALRPRASSRPCRQPSLLSEPSFPCLSLLTVCAPGSTDPKCSAVTCPQGQYASAGACVSCPQGFTTPGSGAVTAGDCSGAQSGLGAEHLPLSSAGRVHACVHAAHAHTATRLYTLHTFAICWLPPARPHRNAYAATPTTHAVCQPGATTCGGALALKLTRSHRGIPARRCLPAAACPPLRAAGVRSS